MTFEEFGTMLRQQRLAKEVSLADIAAATRINIKFLEALENGQFHILPATYVRAFLREYAMMVQLDPAAVLQQYDEIKTSLDVQKSSSSSASSSLVDTQQVSPTPKNSGPTNSARKSIGIIAVIIIVFSMLWFLLSKNKNQADIQPEISFEEVVKEAELTTSKAPQSIVKQTTKPNIPSISDSLVLEILTTDSLWLSIFIDDSIAREYLYPPNVKHTFKAAKSFSLTLGNAG
ncbi:MAG: helix-turn-helix domain-containing protein, partial [Bacteroidetes bacterium]|nr:helix-turn-helix domain-containing protein [Bacteroidota bacterium]